MDYLGKLNQFSVHVQSTLEDINESGFRVDFQIWIADDGHPLPYKYVVTDTSTPELLAFATVMRNWEINPKVIESMFNFQAPQGTYKIEFLEVG